jgi:hypothetical protein
MLELPRLQNDASSDLGCTVDALSMIFKRTYINSLAEIALETIVICLSRKTTIARINDRARNQGPLKENPSGISLHQNQDLKTPIQKSAEKGLALELVAAQYWTSLACC